MPGVASRATLRLSPGTAAPAGPSSASHERQPRILAARLAAHPVQPVRAPAGRGGHGRGRPPGRPALSRRRSAGCARDERALLAVRLPAHGHHRANRAGVRRRRHGRDAGGRGAGDAPGGWSGPADHPGRAAGQPVERAAVRPPGRGGGRVRELSCDPPIWRARGPGQHGAAGLAARPAGFPPAPAPDDPHQRHQRGACHPVRVRLRARDQGRRDGHRAGRICRARHRPGHRARHLAPPGRLAGLARDHGAGPLSPPARGQPRPVPAQPASGGGLRRLRRHRVAPGRGGAGRQRRADELLHRRGLWARRLRPRCRGHGRAYRRCARPARLSRRRPGELRQRRPARGRDDPGLRRSRRPGRAADDRARRRCASRR